jgi:beta-glucanase (GH16 family)
LERIRLWCAAAAFAWGGARAADAGWKLAWSEEFDGPAIDASVWGFETGYVRNQELQYYANRAENSRIDGGRLLIEARRDGWNGHAYTSASLTTRGRKSWRYGRFEMRARIDARPGSWPAWWWLPDAGGWPKGGEIDMMEAYRGECLFNVMDGNGNWSSPARTVAALGGDRWAGGFHTWAMEWDSARIDLFLDGALMNHYPLAQAEGTGPGGSNPFRHPGYLIVNQAIGGTQGGDPSATEFPVLFRVDWIRVHAWTRGPAHELTVQGGAGSGTYAEGALASVSAGLPPPGQVFDHWAVIEGGAELEDAEAEDTRLLMGPADARVAAVFKPGVIALRATGSRAGGSRPMLFLEVGAGNAWGTSRSSRSPRSPRLPERMFTPLGRRAALPGPASPASGAYLSP